MIAGKDEYLNEASSELFKRLADLAVQEECEAREQYYKDKQYLVELRQEVAESKKELTESRKELTENKKELAENKKELTESKKELTESRKELTESQKNIHALNDENKRLRELLEQNNIPY